MEGFEELGGWEVAEGLVRADVVVGVLPVEEVGAEAGDGGRGLGAVVERLAVGTVGAFDAAVEFGTAVSGLKSVSGNPGDLPLLFGHHYPDFGPNPFHGAIALVAALHHRERTGEGQLIELSQYESTISVLGPSVLQYTANGEIPGQMGSHSERFCPHNAYRCRGDDAWCAITVLTDDQWQAFIAIEGLEKLRRPDLDTLNGRTQREAYIDSTIERWTAEWDKEELAAFLQARGVPAGPLQFIDEIVHVDPVLDGDYFHRVTDHPAGGEFLQHPHPARMWRNPARPRRAPILGEHTSDVLSRILGLSEDEIGEYAARGALE